MTRITTNSAPGRAFRLPARWLLAAAGAIMPALVAVFVFEVAVSAALIYGLIGLMIVCHLFMHGHHAAQGGHAGRESHPGDGELKHDRDRHSGGCH